MSRRKALGLALAIVTQLVPAPAPTSADPGTIPRIGFLWPESYGSVALYMEAFRVGLRERGYLEGQDIALEFRGAAGKYDRLPQLAAELVRLKVDAIVAPVTTTALAARDATQAIPIIIVRASDPVVNRLVASLARPGGNITGLTEMAPEITGQRLELLKAVVPRASRVAVLWNPDNPVAAHQLREAEGAARVLGVSIQAVKVRGPNELEQAFIAMARRRAGAFLVTTDAMLTDTRNRIVDLAATQRLPGIYVQRDFVDAGGLMAYGPSLTDLYRRAAVFVDKILKGAKPADLPVEQPTRFELVINMKTAKALGITLPQSILIRVDQVLQ